MLLCLGGPSLAVVGVVDAMRCDVMWWGEEQIFMR